MMMMLVTRAGEGLRGREYRRKKKAKAYEAEKVVSGGGFCGAMRGALTYVGLGQIQLGRSAEQHLFAAKVT